MPSSAGSHRWTPRDSTTPRISSSCGTGGQRSERWSGRIVNASPGPSETCSRTSSCGRSRRRISCLPPPIRERVERFRAEHFQDDMVGVHVRYSDKRVAVRAIRRRLERLLAGSPGSGSSWRRTTARSGTCSSGHTKTWSRRRTGIRCPAEARTTTRPVPIDWRTAAPASSTSTCWLPATTSSQIRARRSLRWPGSCPIGDPRTFTTSGAPRRRFGVCGASSGAGSQAEASLARRGDTLGRTPRRRGRQGSGAAGESPRALRPPHRCGRRARLLRAEPGLRRAGGVFPSTANALPPGIRPRTECRARFDCGGRSTTRPSTWSAASRPAAATRPRRRPHQPALRISTST